jgi:hypothetical protein
MEFLFFLLFFLLLVIAHACPPHAVEHAGWCHVTMDKCPPTAKFGDGTCHTCQHALIRLEAGWELAPCDRDVVDNVIAPHDFGTHVIVCKDGRGFGCKSFAGGAGSERFWITGSTGADNALKTRGGQCSDEAPSYAVLACSRKVLIRARPKILMSLSSLRALLERHDLARFFDSLVSTGGVMKPTDMLKLTDMDVKELNITMVWRKKFDSAVAELNKSRN